MVISSTDSTGSLATIHNRSATKESIRKTTSENVMSRLPLQRLNKKTSMQIPDTESNAHEPTPAPPTT